MKKKKKKKEETHKKVTVDSEIRKELSRGRKMTLIFEFNYLFIHMYMFKATNEIAIHRHKPEA
jgi:hypothetical protein